jgi:hypothetical protein
LYKRARTKKLGLADWIGRNIVLPNVVAEPGPLRLASYLRDIAEKLLVAAGEAGAERVGRSVRAGLNRWWDGLDTNYLDVRCPRGERAACGHWPLYSLTSSAQVSYVVSRPEDIDLK